MKNKKSLLEQQMEQAERDILMVKYQTALKKTQLINELKSGLGDKIKSNPNGFIVHKKSIWQRMSDFLKKIFTKF